MNKKIFLITASIATGLIGSLILKKNKHTTIEKKDTFVGQWTYLRRNQDLVSLTITPDFQLYIRGKNQPVSILKTTANRLIFLDQMGYEIIFEQKDNRYYYYDEAEDSSYELLKKANQTNE